MLHNLLGKCIMMGFYSSFIKQMMSTWNELAEEFFNREHLSRAQRSFSSARVFSIFQVHPEPTLKILHSMKCPFAGLFLFHQKNSCSAHLICVVWAFVLKRKDCEDIIVINNSCWAFNRRPRRCLRENVQNAGKRHVVLSWNIMCFYGLKYKIIFRHDPASLMHELKNEQQSN